MVGCAKRRWRNFAHGLWGVWAPANSGCEAHLFPEAPTGCPVRSGFDDGDNASSSSADMSNGSPWKFRHSDDIFEPRQRCGGAHEAGSVDPQQRALI